MSGLQEKSDISASRKKTGVILVIDDNAELLRLIRNILEIDDHQVFTAEGGIEALAILAKIPPPDLILLDLRMEAMSGTEFLEILEEKMPTIIKNVPVVFLTGMDAVPVSRAVGVIQKPFDINEFLVKVERFIEMGVPPVFVQPNITQSPPEWPSNI